MLTHSIAPPSLWYLSTQRALYTHLVMATCESRYAFNQTTTRVIGHEGLQESPNYTSVIIGKNVLLPRFSLLLVRVSESRYSLGGVRNVEVHGAILYIIGGERVLRVRS